LASVSVERRDAVALIAFENALKRNALDPALIDELEQALARVAEEGARAVVLTAAGDFFSSGFDISALGDEPRAEHPLARLLRAITDGPLPVVAALNGPAIGGGCELAATCDLRVAHPGVALTMPPVRLGIIYDAAGLRRFVALIGWSRTRELFLTAAPVPAERALGWGLVDRVVAKADVLPTALELAGEIARGAPLAVAGTRRVLELLAAPLEPHAALEIAALQQNAWSSEDAREARAAFREKRKPVFKGR
jgi:enoyl-CoA hydratase/carnithine racemase